MANVLSPSRLSIMYKKARTEKLVLSMQTLGKIVTGEIEL